MAIDNEVGALLRLEGREQFTADAKESATAVEQIGTGAQVAGEKATLASKKLGMFGAKAKTSGVVAAKSLGAAGAKAGADFGTNFTVDAAGRLHDANGKFVGAGRTMGAGIRTGAEEEVAMLPQSIGDRMSMGMGVVGARAGGFFGRGFSERAMEYAKVMLGTFAAFFAAEKIKETITESIGMANDAVRAQRQTAAAIKSTGDSSGLTAVQIEGMSKNLEHVTGQAKLTNQGMLNMLLTFPKIRQGGGIFHQASIESANLAARLGMSLPSAARMVGRALNDPVKGLTALSRVGIRFTDTQTNMIKGLVATGQSAKAQHFILGQLQNRVGGAAKANITASDRLRIKWEDFEEMIGKKLLPRVHELENWLANKGIPDLEKFGSWVKKNWAYIRNLTLVLTGLIGAWKVYRGVMLLAAAANAVMEGDQIALNAAMDANPIGAIIMGIAALAVGLIYAYKHSETFRNIVNAAFHVVATAFDFVRDHWKLFAYIFANLMGGPIIGAIVLLITHFGTVKRIALDTFHWITHAASSAYNWVKHNWPLLVEILFGPFGLAEHEIRTHWTGIMGWFRSLPGHLMNALKDVGNIISLPFRTAFNLIATMWNDTVGKVHFSVPGWIPHFGGDGWGFPQMPHWTAMAKGGPVRAGSPYLIGEIGPELFVPDTSGVIIPHSRLGDAVRGGDGSSSLPRLAPATSPNHPATGERIGSEMLGGEGPVTLQLVVDGKVLAETVYKDIRRKDARS